MSDGNLRGDPARARRRRCAATDGAQDILVHWRGAKQAHLVEVEPGKWEGPCPLCGRFRGLHVEVGRNGDVIYTVTGRCHHTREDIYPQLKFQVPCTPNPGAYKYERNPELGALANTIRDLVLHKALTPVMLRLALLEATGTDTEEALDMIGITDKSNRRRAVRDVRRALAPRPGKMVNPDHKRRSKHPPGQNKTADDVNDDVPDRQAKDESPQVSTETEPSPAVMVNPDPPGLSVLTTDAGSTDAGKKPLTSDFTSLTEHATVVSGGAGTPTGTRALDLELEALELLRTALGAEVIATEPRTSPHPVADIAEVWTLAEEGPCVRCRTPTCRYGDRGQPLCADCRNQKAA